MSIFSCFSVKTAYISPSHEESLNVNLQKKNKKNQEIITGMNHPVQASSQCYDKNILSKQ